MAIFTWEGNVAGRRRDDELRSFSGEHIGRFFGDEIYAPDGRYLGEFRANRLITDLAKKETKNVDRFDQLRPRTGVVPPVNVVGRVMVAGFEDFPADEG